MTFTKAFVLTVLLAALFGIVLPFLISSTSNELTILGICVILAITYVVGDSIVKYFKSLNEK